MASNSGTWLPPNGDFYPHHSKFGPRAPSMHSWCQAVCSDTAREGSDLTHPEAAADTARALRQGVVAAHRGEGTGADGRGKGKGGGSSNTEGVRGTAGGWPLPRTGMWAIDHSTQCKTHPWMSAACCTRQADLLARGARTPLCSRVPSRVCRHREQAPQPPHAHHCSSVCEQNLRTW